jgi:Uma2 family endonuclease
LLTVEDFLKVAEPREGHIELHHGEVVVMPPPKKGHQKIQDRLHMLLKQLFADEYVVRIEMAFRPAPEYEVWQADIGCVALERDDATRDDEYLNGSPDLVVEVLSPSNTMDEINEKMAVCMANGCVSFWVADPRRKRVSVTEGNITRHYGETESISCSILAGEIRVREIFE